LEALLQVIAADGQKPT